MESTYFPVPFAKLPSNIEIEELKDFNFAIGPVLVRAQRANHPGMCVGYRLFSPDGIVAFFPDTEPRTGGDDRDMIDFVRDADVLILDSQYDRAEYKKHVGWGHGCVDDSVALALKAGVKKLFLFHHDPDHDDKKIDGFVKHARQLVPKRKAKLKVEAAREGMMIQLSGKIRGEIEIKTIGISFAHHIPTQPSQHSAIANCCILRYYYFNSCCSNCFRKKLNMLLFQSPHQCVPSLCHTWSLLRFHFPKCLT